MIGRIPLTFGKVLIGDGAGSKAIWKKQALIIQERVFGTF